MTPRAGWFLLHRRTAPLDFDALDRILPRHPVVVPLLVASEPHKFMLPKSADMRYNWVVLTLAAIDLTEMTELVVDAWRMVVPKKVFAAYERRQE